MLLCVLAEAVFGEHEGVRLPREDHIERLAEEGRGELRRVSYQVRGYYHVHFGGVCVRRTSRKRPPLMRGSAHPSDISTSSKESDGVVVGLFWFDKTTCGVSRSPIIKARAL